MASRCLILGCKGSFVSFRGFYLKKPHNYYESTFSLLLKQIIPSSITLDLAMLSSCDNNNGAYHGVGSRLLCGILSAGRFLLLHNKEKSRDIGGIALLRATLFFSSFN